MSESVSCDNCGKSSKREGLVGWFELDRTGIDVRRLTDEEGPWHFDSLSCVAAWTEHHALTGFGPRSVVHESGADDGGSVDA